MKLIKLVLAASLVLAPAAILAQATTAPTTPPTPAPVTGRSIHARKVDQQQRIAQGVKNGSLSAGETSRLEHQEAGINKEERGMRAQDNGKLTAGDKKLLNHQQNQESNRIYNTKHDKNGHK